MIVVIWTSQQWMHPLELWPHTQITYTASCIIPHHRTRWRNKLGTLCMLSSQIHRNGCHTNHEEWCYLVNTTRCHQYVHAIVIATKSVYPANSHAIVTSHLTASDWYGGHPPTPIVGIVPACGLTSLVYALGSKHRDMLMLDHATYTDW